MESVVTIKPLSSIGHVLKLGESQQKKEDFQKSPAVDRGNKAVGLHPDFLGEVVAEMPPGLLPGAVGDHGEDGVHGEGEVDAAGALLCIGRGLGWCW